MRLLIATILLMIGVCASAQTIPSSEQVEDLLRQGNVAEAKIALQQVLAAKPNSPKANYYMAQLVQMENGDITQYQPKYKPYLNKVAAEKAKAEEAEMKRQAEINKSFLKFLGYLVLVILVLIFSAMFIPDMVSNYKEKKRNEEKEKLRLEYEDTERRNILKDILKINEILEANIFKDEEKAREHRKYALDAIEVLSEKGDYNLSLIRLWIIDVNNFIKWGDKAI